MQGLEDWPYAQEVKVPSRIPALVPLTLVPLTLRLSLVPCACLPLSPMPPSTLPSPHSNVLEIFGRWRRFRADFGKFSTTIVVTRSTARRVWTAWHGRDIYCVFAFWKWKPIPLRWRLVRRSRTGRVHLTSSSSSQRRTDPRTTIHNHNNHNNHNHNNSHAIPRRVAPPRSVQGRRHPRHRRNLCAAPWARTRLLPSVPRRVEDSSRRLPPLPSSAVLVEVLAVVVVLVGI